MSVRQLLSSVDSKELSEWLAFFQVQNEPKKDSPTSEDLAAQLKVAFPKKVG